MNGTAEVLVVWAAWRRERWRRQRRRPASRLNDRAVPRRQGARRRLIAESGGIWSPNHE